MQYNVSLDKIKFSGTLLKPFKKWHIRDFPLWLECPFHDFECIQKYENNSFNCYRYNYLLSVKGSPEGHVYVGVSWNGGYDEKQNDRYFVLEYNPNKCGSLIYQYLCEHLVFEIRDIKHFDLAFDIVGKTTSDVKIITRCDTMTYGNNTSKTYYIAPKARNARVKIYDKHLERQKYNEVIPDTLRLEVSINCRGLTFDTIHFNGKLSEELTAICDHLNSVHIRDKPYNNDYVAFLLDHVDDTTLQKAFNMMSYNTKDKYKKKIKASYHSLDIDVLTLLKHISTLLYPYKGRIKIK